MTGHLSERARWTLVTTFAIAMAWVEAASVFYIRALVDRVEPYQPHPLPINDALGNVELWREASTLVMLATLGILAGRTWTGTSSSCSRCPGGVRCWRPSASRW
jgi:hypothetical protein